MVGFTPSLSAAVWVGNDNPNDPIENASGQIVYGAGLPGAIWQQFMDTVLAGTPEEDLPNSPRIRGDTGQGVAAPQTQAPPTTQAQPTQAAPTSQAPDPAPTPTPTPTTAPPPPPADPTGDNGDVVTGEITGGQDDTAGGQPAPPTGTDGTGGNGQANGQPAPAAPTTQPQPQPTG
jgi:membrane peptidoglycan carboxypeptidase